MVRQILGAGSLKVYDVSGRASASLEASLRLGARATAAEQRARRKSELKDRETELLHDFSFPTVSNRIKVAPDSRHIFATGTYPPQIHVYDTEELSLKFKRHVSSEIVDFQILESDWRKFALLNSDRYLDIHSPYGSHFRTRVPKVGRGVLLYPPTCDLFVCGAGADVWRLNLEQGRFLAPLSTSSGLNGGNNVSSISPVNGLLGFGGESGLVDIWDPRALGQDQRPAGCLDVRAALASYGDYSPRQSLSTLALTALCFDESDGVSFALGTSHGQTVLFDLRSPGAVLVKEQGYESPVHSVHLHRDAQHCISADARSIKVWDRTNGKNSAAIEPEVDVNHVSILGGSGVVCAAVEDSRVRSYYMPWLAPAPAWCAFLESVTEELHDSEAINVDRGDHGKRAKGGDDGAHSEVEVYENYKFVPCDKLDGLGLRHLEGTSLLKPYMHGFFVHNRLYRRAVDAASPFVYEEYRKERARQKVEAERESRIGRVRKRTAVERAKVNKQVVQRLLQKQEEASGKKARTAATIGSSILEDSRFQDMFQKEDFAVDESAERFLQLNPSGTSGHRPRDDSNSVSDSDGSIYDHLNDDDVKRTHPTDPSSDESSDTD